MHRPIAYILHLLLVCLHGGALAQAHPMHHGQHGAHGAMREAGRADLGAFAAFDTRGTLWAAHKDAGYVVVSRSDNQGKTWSPPLRVTPSPEATDTGADARPKVALGSAGEVYVTWTRPLSRPYTGEIRFARSVDGGKTFSAPIVVHADRQQITHRFDSIAVNRDGKVFVVWIDKRDGIAAGKLQRPYRGAAIYFAVSDDQGATFRGDYRVADHSCECCRIALLPRADGSVLAMWRHVFEPNIRDHALAALAVDGRVAPVRRATFDDWRIDACPHHGPSLAADEAGRLHGVWFTQGARQSGVLYGRLSEGSVEGQRRVGGERAEHADLAIIGRRIAVAWKEFDGEHTQLRAMVSDDAGTNWREMQLGTTHGPSDQPRVLAHNQQFHVFWNTRHEPLSMRTIP